MIVEIADLADPNLGQYFLVSPEKLAKVVSAAGINPTDDVVELGAGVGTVARVFPESRSLTLVEFDGRLLDLLRQNVPHAHVIHGDALEIISTIAFDVLIGNLPHGVTESLLTMLSDLSFRTAVLSVAESADLGQLGADLAWSDVETVTGDDFLPPQPGVSRIVRVARARS